MSIRGAGKVTRQRVPVTANMQTLKPLFKVFKKNFEEELVLSYILLWVVHLPHSHLNKTFTYEHEWKIKHLEKKSDLLNTWELLTASVKYMKF